MMQPVVQSAPHNSMTLLSRLLLSPRHGPKSWMLTQLKSEIKTISKPEFDDLLALSSLNHVVVRGMEMLLNIMIEAEDQVRAEWARSALLIERGRINLAMGFLHRVCNAFEEESYDITVIKSLDHWPDLGSDLDLYTNTDFKDVANLMRRHFHAEIATRSWGDRLACKYNFMVPGLPEAVEIHMGRLGQTGEQTTIAACLAERSQIAMFGNTAFRVPSAADRLMVSSLQRMYRHFYFRLCDIVDSAELADSGGINYEQLRSFATAAGIWEGVATYLAVVSDYVSQYRGVGINLPPFVRATARFGGEEVYFNNAYLRIPIMPESVRLYGSQLAGLLRKRELHNGARLSLLPWLATAAAVGQKITGSDKGIW